MFDLIKGLQQPLCGMLPLVATMYLKSPKPADVTLSDDTLSHEGPGTAAFAILNGPASSPIANIAATAVADNAMDCLLFMCLRYGSFVNLLRI
jgi:hypothetical protein